MRNAGRSQPYWRVYQRVLQRDAARCALLRRVPALLAYSCGGFLLLVCIVGAWVWISSHMGSEPAGPDGEEHLEAAPGMRSLREIAPGLEATNLNGSEPCDHLVFQGENARLVLKTSLNPKLQAYILKLLRRSKTVKAAVVVLKPSDGRILAMASYDETGHGDNLCVKAEFPAASLFKIVSAAAAIEAAGYSPDQQVHFVGRQHTLYKRQLKEGKGRYATKILFRKAFALSINPVFGKVGIYQLGRDMLDEYAGRFLFNRAIGFDLPVETSPVVVTDDEFELAEIASGFNKRTRISPLHAALLASAAVNGGVIMKPWFVESVTDDSGEVLYRVEPGTLSSAVDPETAGSLRVLMGDTVRYGTCRRSLRKLTRKRTFKAVELGGKTGTINDKSDRFKYDWLTAYALPRNGDEAICIAVVGMHGKILGVRAAELGRSIIDFHMSS